MWEDGDIRPILCSEIWSHYFESLAVHATPVRHEEAKSFTSTYDNFIQTAGIRDGVSHCAKILSVFYDNLDTDDPVIIKIDISNAFNTTCRALTLDVPSGRASRDYACGHKEGQAISTCENLSNLFSVDVLLVTTLVASKKGRLSLLVNPCLTYSAISKPCAHATLN